MGEAAVFMEGVPEGRPSVSPGGPWTLPSGWDLIPRVTSHTECPGLRKQSQHLRSVSHTHTHTHAHAAVSAGVRGP